MTPLSIVTYPDPKDEFDWTVAEAKAKFSEVVDRARNDRPQTSSKNGRAAMVVVSAEEWTRKTKRVGSLVDFLRLSPLRGTPLDLQRKKGRRRKLKL